MRRPRPNARAARGLRSLAIPMGLAAAVVTARTDVAGAVSTWTAPQVLNGTEWNNGVSAQKDPRIVGLPGGGFGVSYWSAGPGDVRYRRIQSNMTFSGPTTVVYDGVFTPNDEIAVMNDGTVRLAWEKWNEPSSTGPQYATRRINNDGSYILTENTQLIDASANNSKWPVIAAFGMANDARAVASYWNSSNSQMRYVTNNGSSWGTDTRVNSLSIDNQYVCTNITRSPMDGSVWRTYAVKTSSSPNTYSIRMVNFSATTQTWGSPVDVQTGITYFPSRLQVTANHHGRVLVAWDSDNSTTAKIYTPGSGFGSNLLAWTNKSYFGNVAAVPGAPNDWWIFNTYGSGSFPMIRPIVNGTMDGVAYPAEYPADGSTSGVQIFNPRGAIDQTGRVAFTYEGWVNGANPQIYMSYRNERSYIGGVWLGAGVGNWSDASKWAGMVIPNASDLNVRLDYGSPAASSTTLDQNATVGAIQVDAGDTININAGRTLTIAGTTATVLAGNVTNSGVINLQASSATLSTSATHSGVFNVAAGATLNFAGGTHALNNPAGSFTGGGAVNVTAGALVAANADTLTGANLTIGTGASVTAQAGLGKAVSLGSVATTGTGKFDVTNNSLVVKGMSDTQVRPLLVSGYNGGAWNGATGIVSSSVTSETSIGYATNAQLGNLTEFKGVTGLAGTDVLVKYTYAGDANLDGKVDIGDLGLLAGAWQQASGKVWFDGDFTYDGVVDIGDLGLLAGNWQKGTPGNPSTPLMSFSEAMAMFTAFEGVAVPEPSSAMALAGLGLLCRRRRLRPGKQ